MSDADKPRIRRVRLLGPRCELYGYVWGCNGGGWASIGTTPLSAYLAWKQGIEELPLDRRVRMLQLLDA